MRPRLARTPEESSDLRTLRAILRAARKARVAIESRIARLGDRATPELTPDLFEMLKRRRADEILANDAARTAEVARVLEGLTDADIEENRMEDVMRERLADLGEDAYHSIRRRGLAGAARRAIIPRRVIPIRCVRVMPIRRAGTNRARRSHSQTARATAHAADSGGDPEPAHRPNPCICICGGAS